MGASASQSVADSAARRDRPDSARRAPERFTPVPVTGGPVLQRQPGCACGGGCPRCQHQAPAQSKLSISSPGDVYEREADGVAEQVMRMPDPHGRPGPALAVQRYAPAVQRKCAACEEEQEEEMSASGVSVQRKEAGRAPLITAEVDEQINSVRGGGGEPLPGSVRAFFEPRFGHDFSRVRVHSDGRAAAAARAVNALAFTVGQDIVFGAGQYAPQTAPGQKLLAHELTHAAQQSSAHASGGAMLQRACIEDPECKPRAAGELPGSGVKGSATHFVDTTNENLEKEAAKEKKKTPEEVRRELCRKEPPDPACTADGHGRRATEFEKVFKPMAPKQFAMITGVFVDKDIPSNYGAYRLDCAYFSLKIEGDQCVFIPERRETEAAAYNKGDKKVGGQDRDDWLTARLSTMTHELEHARYAKEFSKEDIGKCKFSDVTRELTEMAAIMSEFPIKYRASAEKSWYERRPALDSWFEYKLTQPSEMGETVAGIIKAIRCRCECDEVNGYIRRVADFTTADWKEEEKNYFHTELRKPKWKLNWPIETPQPQPPDIPSPLWTPSGSIGFGSLGAGGISYGLGLDLGIPVDRLGKWQLLVGAQGRAISDFGEEQRRAFLLGMKVGFLKGPALGQGGVQFGAYGEAGLGRFDSRLGPAETGTYAGGGVKLGYSPGIVSGLGPFMPFIGVDLFGGARIDETNPEVLKIFSTGVVIGGQF